MPKRKGRSTLEVVSILFVVLLGVLNLAGLLLAGDYIKKNQFDWLSWRPLLIYFIVIWSSLIIFKIYQRFK